MRPSPPDAVISALPIDSSSVTVKNMAVGRAKSAKLGDRNAWLAERPGQTTVPRTQLVDGIRRLLAEIDEGVA